MIKDKENKMADKYKQTYVRNPNFFKIMAILVTSIFLSNSLVFYLKNKGEALLAQFATGGVLLACAIICGALIYKNLTHYTYEIIDDKLFFERAIGKSNHIYFHIGRKDIKDIYSYLEIKNKESDGVKKFKFVIDKETDKWLVIDFVKKGRDHRLIIHPDSEFKSGIDKWLNKGK